MHVDEAWGYNQAYGINNRSRLRGRQEAHFRNAAALDRHIRTETRSSRAVDDQPVLDEDIEHIRPPISHLSRDGV
jgi:hypothetical protein